LIGRPDGWEYGVTVVIVIYRQDCSSAHRDPVGKIHNYLHNSTAAQETQAPMREVSYFFAAKGVQYDFYESIFQAS